MLAQRLRSSGRAIFRTVSPKAWGGGGSSIWQTVGLPNLKRKSSNTWSAVQETYLSTKQVFESHRVVFTIGTSLTSILTAWAGYSLRQYHQSKIEKRLGSIEQALKNNYEVEHQEIKKIVSSGNASTAVCIATAWTSLVIGYGLGWRGGAWYTNRKFRREQLKLMGQIKPQKWQFLRRPFVRFGRTRPVHRIQTSPPVANAGSLAPQQLHKSQ
ncbi:uncharacterized protein LOC103714087 [Phoenix dactylifera]|uniref:Uncharacterized protein LOC103714087 n=1 Tax=Phoenix dactylifera TaxID=42345 RepID=A0A8B7CHM1_PHODC|nr:uncharacterized protein LOC103714087 [Phoenix dactylifera]